MDYTLPENFIKDALLKTRHLFIPFKGNNYKPKFLQSRFLLYCALCLLVLKIAAVILFADLPQNIFFADITKVALLSFVNQSREAAGLEPLIENDKLDKAAYLKAEDMFKNEYFLHQSPQGISPWYWFKSLGYNYKYAGENLAIGFFESTQLYNAWYSSKTHRDNILNPNYQEIGTAVLKGNFQGNNVTVVVQLFGTPQPIISQIPIASGEIQSQIKTQQKIAENSIEKNDVASQKEVLSETSEYPAIKSAEGIDNNSLYFKFLNFIIYSYEEILQNIIYAFLILVAVSLLLNLFARIDIQDKDLILRSVLIMIMLLLAAIINKGFITYIIPHKILI